MEKIVIESKSIISPVVFLDTAYDRFEYLIEAFANNFDEAIAFFTKNSIKENVITLSQEAIDLTNEFESIFKSTKDKKAKERLLFEYLYTAYPSYSKFCYKTIKAYSLGDLRFDLLTKLETKKISDKEFAVYEQLIDNKILSTYLKIKNSENQELVDLIHTLESDKTNFMSARNKSKTLYTLCYILSDKKEYTLDSFNFTNKDEFVDYVSLVYKTSFNELNKLCKKLMPRRLLDVKLEAWLYSLGYKNELRKFNDKIATNIDSLIDVEEEATEEE